MQSRLGAGCLALLLALGSAGPASGAPHPESISYDSDMVRELLEQPADDVFELLVAKRIFRAAGSPAYESQIELYLETLAAALLSGKEPPQAATIGDIIRGSFTPDWPLGGPRQFLANIVYVQRVAKPPPRFPGELKGGEARAVAPGAWVVIPALGKGDESTFLLVEAANERAGLVIEKLEARLRFANKKGTYRLDCEPKAVAIAPRGSARLLCSIETRHLAPEKLVEELGSIGTKLEVWWLEASEMGFKDAEFDVQNGQLRWPRQGLADNNALGRIRSASCERRNVCPSAAEHAWDVAKEKFNKATNHPLGGTLIAASTLAIVLGGLARLIPASVRTRILKWLTLISFIAYLGIGWAIVHYEFGGGYWIFLLMIYAFFGLLGLFAFNLLIYPIALLGAGKKTADPDPGAAPGRETAG